MTKLYGNSKLTYAVIQVRNSLYSETEYNNFTVLMFGVAEDVYVDDQVVFYGLPIGNYAYTNTLGEKHIHICFWDQQ